MVLYMGPQGNGSLLLAPSSENIKPALSSLSRRRNQSSGNVVRINGTDAVYNGYLLVKVIHQTNVERFGEGGDVITDDHQISFQSISIPFAKRGGKFNLNDQTFTLKTPLDRSKEGMQTWVIN